jgi:hypothetical protein
VLALDNAHPVIERVTGSANAVQARTRLNEECATVLGGSSLRTSK